MTTNTYIKEMIAAIRANNPTQWPRYQDDPKGVWRYIARSIGSGLDMNNKSDANAIGGLYGQIVVMSEFGRPGGVTISAKQFIGWLLETAKPKKVARDTPIASPRSPAAAHTECPHPQDAAPSANCHRQLSLVEFP